VENNTGVTLTWEAKECEENGIKAKIRKMVSSRDPCKAKKRLRGKRASRTKKGGTQKKSLQKRVDQGLLTKVRKKTLKADKKEE